MSADEFSGKSGSFGGWRIAFLISLLLVGISLYIRMRMEESPIFEQMKISGMTSANPLIEAFTKWENLKRVLISLFGATAGQGVVWYTGQFYALFYMQSILNINATSANYIVAIALLLAMPFFVIFGALSDKVGRKWIILAGCLLAVVTYMPIYKAMRDVAGSNIVTVTSQKNPATGAITLTPMKQESGDEVPLPSVQKSFPYTTFSNLMSDRHAWMLVLLVFVQVLWVTMVYGPIAAYLVEAFPANIRYTALSLPYHIGNGVFGGLLPVIGLTVVAQTGNIYAGLYYPMIVAAITFVVGAIFLKETHGHRIWDEVSK